MPLLSFTIYQICITKFVRIASIVCNDLFHSLNRFVNNGSTVVKDLALGYVQLFSPCKNADLSLHDYSSGDCPTPSLAKGLPHFCTGKMRCWGRDTFIALRGLMLVTEQYECARYLYT